LSPKEKSFKLRLEEKEWLKLKKESEKAGFRNIAEFVRYVTIGEGREIVQELKDMKEILKKLEEK
jgi:hypothetical protein